MRKPKSSAALQHEAALVADELARHRATSASLGTQIAVLKGLCAEAESRLQEHYNTCSNSPVHARALRVFFEVTKTPQSLRDTVRTSSWQTHEFLGGAGCDIRLTIGTDDGYDGALDALRYARIPERHVYTTIHELRDPRLGHYSTGAAAHKLTALLDVLRVGNAPCQAVDLMLRALRDRVTEKQGAQHHRWIPVDDPWWVETMRAVADLQLAATLVNGMDKIMEGA